jgi:hypothetical protein
MGIGAWTPSPSGWSIRAGKPTRSIGASGVALNGRQLADGYVLLCVARPLCDCTLEVGVESHDKLYRNPFQSPLGPDELKPGILAASHEDTS